MVYPNISCLDVSAALPQDGIAIGLQETAQAHRHNQKAKGRDMSLHFTVSDHGVCMRLGLPGTHDHSALCIQ